MARIIALSNQKGGVGKTTTAVNLAASLAAAGQRVLLVDVDPQGNATSGLGFARTQLGRGVYDVLLGFEDIEHVIVPTEFDNLSLLPATAGLVGAEVELVDQNGRETRLRDALDDVRADFDYVLIDCPPSLSLLTLNALVASDRVLIPLQAEYYAMEGLSQLLRTITAVRRSLNPDLRREGIVVTMYDSRNNLCREVALQAEELFGEEVFRTVIPRNVRLGEAPSYGRPVLHYDARSTGSQAYLKLARELLKRHGVSTSMIAEEVA